MTVSERTLLDVTIIAADPPFVAGDGVLFGLQSRGDVEEPCPACATTEFDTTIEIIGTTGSAADFAGEHVHGRRGDRFVYLAWGASDHTEPFVMVARAKIKLGDIPLELLDSAIRQGRSLIAELQATDAKGQPASGTIRPPAIDWHVL